MRPAEVAGVLPGIDILIRERSLKRCRLGLITNPSGVTSRGVPSWKGLRAAGYSIGSLFGPEHGFRGAAQDAVKLGDDRFQGMKVYSLYGERLSPSPEMLRELDTLVFDLQEVGSRYYTYLYTLAYAMKTCRQAGKELVVLDRPNPIGGRAVEGGPIPEGCSSFVGGFGLAHRHGLTIGEFAHYLKGHYFPEVNLRVVRMEGYKRAYFHADTGLPWVSPSPNIPSPQSALVYPGTCLFEGTNLSEGRGTTRPFETIGAPWLDGESFREALQELDLPGVVFTAAFFTPSFSKYQGQLCQGVSLQVLDREAFRPLFTGLAMLWVLKRDYAERLGWKSDWEGAKRYFIDKLAGGSYLRTMLDSGTSLDALRDRTEAGLPEYLARRREHLLYC